MRPKPCVITGIQYEPANEISEVRGQQSCDGCAARHDIVLCRSFPSGCAAEGASFIWIKSQDVGEPNQDAEVPAAPTPEHRQPNGRKDDSGKLDVTLLFDDMPHALEAVTEVLQWAITKKQPVPYERGSWQGVEDFQRRYRGAQLRHELNRSKSKLAGKPAVDHETGLRELAHIATDALFRLEMACRAEKGLVVVDGGAD